MTQADYQVLFIDVSTGNLIDIISQRRFVSLEYTRLLNDVGEFTLSLPIEDRAASITQKDLIMEVYRKNSFSGTFEVEETYLRRYRKIFYDPQTRKEYVIFGGKSLNVLLQRRIVRPEDDPLSAGGYSSKYDLAEQVMNEFVSQQMVLPFNDLSRALPNFFIEPVIQVGQYVFQRRRYEKLYDVIVECALKGQVDFRIYRNLSTNLVFSAGRIGRDMSLSANYPFGYWLYFDEKTGVVLNPALTDDSYNEVNAVYVMGQGTGSNQQVLLITGGTINDSPLNRCEDTTDSRDTEFGVVDGLITTGQAFITDKQPKIILDFELDLTKSSVRYNVDWFLGDRVTGAYKDVRKNVRIAGVSVVVNRDGETITITLDDKFDRGPN